jgi:hypothetical protein
MLALRLIAAVILLHTLFFKFTGVKESVYIFSTLGLEPWGRIGTGVVELVAAILLSLVYCGQRADGPAWCNSQTGG